MTVAQTVLHGRFAHLNYPRVYSAEDKKIASDCMEQLGISELANIPLSELSGGMQQNTYIAMALAGRSDYILLDEPTSYLDVSNKFRLMHTLKALCSQGKGIVAVMHDLTLALQFADNIVVVHSNGSLTKLSTEQLFTSDIIPNTFGVKIGRHTIENEHIYYLYQTKNKHL
jgi:iron complex transport system ATP-binding protein